MITSNRIANRAPIGGTLKLGFASFIPVPKPTRMLATIPNHPIIVGTTPEVTNTIENASVPMDQQTIALTILLFIAFSHYNIILGIVWAIFRIGEGLIQFYNEPYYWGFLSIARKYSVSSGAEKNSLSNLARTIFKTKDFRFKYAMTLPCSISANTMLI